MESEGRTIQELVACPAVSSAYMLAPAGECESHKEATSRSAHGAISHFDKDIDRGSLHRGYGRASGTACRSADSGRRLEEAGSGDFAPSPRADSDRFQQSAGE